MSRQSDSKKIKGDSEQEEVLPYKYLITSYGADYTVDMVVKRMRDGAIIVPVFQRAYVWTHKTASRFIESLLLGLPVPGIFLSREEDTGKLLVIDGQQRLRSLLFFYNGEFEDSKTPFILKGVQPQFEGMTYKTLRSEDKRRLDDSIIHATIIKQDVPSNDSSSIFFVFERLNTGGTVLAPQEIRAGIYQGAFNDLLMELNEHDDWRELYGKRSIRSRDQELILRFFALYFNSGNYEKPLKEFLNKFMADNRNLENYSGDLLGSLFVNTVGVILHSIGRMAFRLKNQPTAALIDAVMIGVSKRLQAGPIKSGVNLKKRFGELIENNDFISAISTATSDEENIRTRIRLATEFFSDVK